MTLVRSGLPLTSMESSKINLRKDTSFGFALNTPGVFVGEILNSENIGKSSDELVDMWNAEFPDDPVEDEE